MCFFNKKPPAYAGGFLYTFGLTGMCLTSYFKLMDNLKLISGRVDDFISDMGFDDNSFLDWLLLNPNIMGLKTPFNGFSSLNHIIANSFILLENDVCLNTFKSLGMIGDRGVVGVNYSVVNDMEISEMVWGLNDLKGGVPILFFNNGLKPSQLISSMFDLKWTEQDGVISLIKDSEFCLGGSDSVIVGSSLFFNILQELNLKVVTFFEWQQIPKRFNHWDDLGDYVSYKKDLNLHYRIDKGIGSMSLKGFWVR